MTAAVLILRFSLATLLCLGGFFLVEHPRVFGLVTFGFSLFWGARIVWKKRLHERSLYLDRQPSRLMQVLFHLGTALEILVLSAIAGLIGAILFAVPGQMDERWLFGACLLGGFGLLLVAQRGFRVEVEQWGWIRMPWILGVGYAVPYGIREASSWNLALEGGKTTRSLVGAVTDLKLESLAKLWTDAGNLIAMSLQSGVQQATGSEWLGDAAAVLLSVQLLNGVVFLVWLLTLFRICLPRPRASPD